MQSHLHLDQETKTNYFRSYEGENNFSAEIIMNPRDAMVFAKITQLPETENQAVYSVQEFLALLAKEYGAKCFVSIDSELLKKLPAETLKSTKGVARHITMHEAQNAIEKAKEKEHIAVQLEKCKTEYQFLTKKELASRAEELSDFIIRYSSFASEEKINFGQYSVTAQKDKLNNPYVEQFAIVHEGKIIAAMMVLFTDKNKETGYISDFVVHPKYRSKDMNPNQLDQSEKHYPHGMAQLLCIKVCEQIHAGVKNLIIITGGYGGKSVGAHLYDDVFPTSVLQNNADLQNTLGLFLRFDDPGRELLLAANRNADTRLVNENENKDRDNALSILKLSPEQNLAAKQPEAHPAIPVQAAVRLSSVPFGLTPPVAARAPSEEEPKVAAVVGMKQ